MSDDSLKVLFSALKIAVFERSDDGSFLPLTPPPAWFPLLASGTFPFLGHILEEANIFWQSGRAGIQSWGPAAQTDERGLEFHYMVSAVSGANKQYLLFQLDRASDRLRDVLQTVREQKLHDDQARQVRSSAATSVHSAGDEVYAVIGHLARTPLTPEQRELIDRLTAACHTLVAAANQLI